MRAYILLVITFILAWPCAAAEITIDAAYPLLWKMDGQPFRMFGIRVASASKDTATTNHLIAQLNDYKAHKVNAVSVAMMGSSADHYDPFNSTGTEIDAGHSGRLEQIINACNSRSMVVVLTIFYQRSDSPNLANWEASKTAVTTTANWIKAKGWKNVVLNIANEQNSKNYDTYNLPWKRVRIVSDLLSMVRLANSAYPALIVCAGGYDHANNKVIGKSPDVDALLFDTDGNAQHSGDLYQEFRAAGVNKPMANIEMFGGWTKDLGTGRLVTPQGHFPPTAKSAYRKEVDDANDPANPGLSVFFHSSPWTQGPFSKPAWPIRYDLAGQGAESDPGISWWFQYVRDWSAPVIPPTSGATFKEVGGLVSMEAEHAGTITGWTTVAGQSDSALEDAGGSLTYSINFSQPGDYTVYLLARYTGNDQKARNDCLVQFNGQKLYASDGVLRPDGMRTHSATGGWTFFPKGPGAHTPDAIKNLPVFLRVPAAGKYPFVISSRSIGMVVDKIVLKRNGGSEGKPTGTGPAETVSNDTSPTGLIFKALDDFPNTNAGAVPYYKDKARGVLAIDASVVANRDKFARAEFGFTGTAGKYDVTITTSTEIDGESTYRLLINGATVGEYKNPRVELAGDHKALIYTWDGIDIPANAKIAIESNSHSNGIIPEAGGFAWARGRWKQIELKKIELKKEGSVPPTNVAPVVNVGPNRPATLPTPAALDGTVTDDALP